MEKFEILEFLRIFGDFWDILEILSNECANKKTKQFKNLKYEGMVKPKIF